MTNEAPRFDVVMRGYQRREVDAWVAQVRSGVTGPPTFTLVMRGYHPGQVDQYVAQVMAGR
ncbi:MAG TPA: DivIVA domain-containing protein [Actinocatenispora sp.]